MDEPATIYNDGVFEVALMRGPELPVVGLRWLEPRPYRDHGGEDIETTNVMGGATDWFLLPHSLGVAVARAMLDRRMAGLEGFDSEGVTKLVRWLVESGELPDSMCY